MNHVASATLIHAKCPSSEYYERIQQQQPDYVLFCGKQHRELDGTHNARSELLPHPFHGRASPHNDYLSEQRVAFEEWAAHVEEMVFRTNVSSLGG